MVEQVEVGREVYGSGENLLLCGSVERLPAELLALEGKVQCVYLDPPFMSGDHYARRRPYGEKGWKTGKPSPQYPAFEDRFTDEEEYLQLLRRLVSAGRELLRETGVFCLHLDWHMSAEARLLCDREFGKDRFLNEIIWSYESGGRAKKHFPRKHDVILLYAKTRHYSFDLTKVPLPRNDVRKNHMARRTDEEGRQYSCIVSNGNACEFCLKKKIRNAVEIDGSTKPIVVFKRCAELNILNKGIIVDANGIIIDKSKIFMSKSFFLSL